MREMVGRKMPNWPGEWMWERSFWICVEEIYISLGAICLHDWQYLLLFSIISPAQRSLNGSKWKDELEKVERGRIGEDYHKGKSFG